MVRLWKATVASLRAWRSHIDPAPDAPLFPNRTGQPLSRSGVEDRLQSALTTATKRCPSRANRRVSPHTLRHTTAMHLLQSGVDITVVALWLGHEDTATTHLYIEADLAMKTAALNRLQAPSSKTKRFTPPDDLFAFLEKL